MQDGVSRSVTHHSTAERKSLSYGIRIYKDDAVRYVRTEDTRGKWNILLFRTELYSADIGFKKSGLYIAPVLLMYDGLEVGDEFKGCLLSIPFSSWRMFDSYNLERTFESRSFSPYLELSQKDLDSVGLLMSLMENAIGAEEGHVSAAELTYVCRALMATIQRYCNSVGAPGRLGSGDRICDRFLRLVEVNCLKERALDFYAAELGVSAKYLSYKVSQVTGKKANRWIADQIIKEIQWLLVSTTYSIHEVAERTEFKNLSDFCRFFRVHTGTTPMKYRQENRNR